MFTLDNWSTVKGTLYEGQKLIDLLNMQAGDQKLLERETLSQIIN
jgi:hypothetical protein